MHDVASIIAFKRKQIASLTENGSDPAKDAIKRLTADIAGLDPTSAEGAAVAAAAAAAAPVASPAPAVDDTRLVAAEKAIADLGALVQQLASRLAVVEVLSTQPGV